MTPAAPASAAKASLAGRHALITGASRGIGFGIAYAFAASGCRVTLVGRNAENLVSAAARLRDDLGADCQTIPVDVTDSAQVAGLVEQSADRFGGVDILINNAGKGQSAAFHRMDEVHWRRMMSLNLDSVFMMTRAFLPAMRDKPYGRVINVASTAGLTGYAYVAAYCAAKHGVIGLTRALAREYAGTNITVNAVCPGYAETDMTAETIANIRAKTGRSEAEARAELAKSNPQGRLVQPEEVADAVLWLAGPLAASITGQAIAVAGGEIL